MSLTAANRTSRTSGFTLVELMVGMTLSAIIITAVLSAYLFLARNLTRLAYQQQLESSSRRAMYLFKQDAAGAVALSSASTTSVTFTGIPLKSTDTYYPGTQTATYSYSGGTLSRTLTKIPNTGSSSTPATTSMMSNMTSFSFKFYDSAGGSTTGTPVVSVKRVEFTFNSSLGTSGSGTLTSFAAVSPRTAVRNKPLLQ